MRKILWQVNKAHINSWLLSAVLGGWMGICICLPVVAETTASAEKILPNSVDVVEKYEFDQALNSFREKNKITRMQSEQLEHWTIHEGLYLDTDTDYVGNFLAPVFFTDIDQKRYALTAFDANIYDEGAAQSGVLYYMLLFVKHDGKFVLSDSDIISSRYAGGGSGVEIIRLGPNKFGWHGTTDAIISGFAWDSEHLLAANNGKVVFIGSVDLRNDNTGAGKKKAERIETFASWGFQPGKNKAFYDLIVTWHGKLADKPVSGKRVFQPNSDGRYQFPKSLDFVVRGSGD